MTRACITSRSATAGSASARPTDADRLNLQRLPGRIACFGARSQHGTRFCVCVVLPVVAALSSPDGVSTSGSLFAFSMFSDAAGTTPALTNDTTDGFAFIVNVNPDGSTTLTDYSDQTSVGPETSATPEPGSLLLVASGLAMLTIVLLRRKSLASKQA